MKALAEGLGLEPEALAENLGLEPELEEEAPVKDFGLEHEKPAVHRDHDGVGHLAATEIHYQAEEVPQHHTGKNLAAKELLERHLHLREKEEEKKETADQH